MKGRKCDRRRCARRPSLRRMSDICRAGGYAFRMPQFTVCSPSTGCSPATGDVPRAVPGGHSWSGRGRPDDTTGRPPEVGVAGVDTGGDASTSTIAPAPPAEVGLDRRRMNLVFVTVLL